jgi:hypothetical protein
MIWASIIQGEIAVTFEIQEGLKINSANYKSFGRTLSYLGIGRNLPVSKRK